ncbi:MAG TPA: aromatic ring-hydroxylating dioxygenase subunit alpha [Thermomicrobiales bacterium]|nr:aromatic ring-hydroxylating dioxygenase subunit alpha [Thermomicrobiales bacterium]
MAGPALTVPCRVGIMGQHRRRDRLLRQDDEELSMVTTELPRTRFESTLPGRYFWDPEIYDRERDRIFSSMWVCVGRADDLPEAGRYLLADVGRESVVIVRGRDGLIRAFLNVCRHRGARLCTDPCGSTGQAIQCRYHAWSYALDGRLIGAPNIAREEGFDRDAFGLIPVHCEVWEGLIWLNLADDPESLANQIEPTIAHRLGSLEKFGRWGVGNLALGRRIEYDVRANWKLIVENFMECYHCGPVHPELVRLVPEFRNGTSYQGLPGQGSYLGDDIEAFALSGKGDRPHLPGLLPEDERIYYGWVLWPNVFVNLLPDHVILHTLQPLGPGRSRVVCDWLFDPAEVAKSDFDPTDTVAAFDITNRQDWEVCELTQPSMSSKAYERGGVFVENEHHITAFRDMVLERLGDLPS